MQLDGSGNVTVDVDADQRARALVTSRRTADANPGAVDSRLDTLAGQFFKSVRGGQLSLVGANDGASDGVLGALLPRLRRGAGYHPR